MRELLRYLPLPARWVSTLAGALAFAGLLWYLGPTLGFGSYRPLENVTVRLVAVGVILVIWAAATWYMRAREAAANKKLIAGAAGEGQAAGESSSAEIAILRQRLEEAQRHLKRLRGADRRGRKYLYELPWYLLIGPPGAGKTTALTNCGLRFPLAERHGNRPIRGAAGTRNCDWFLTDEAVLVDTAGRYTTQDSDEKADEATWLGFLDLLKATRPRQPINGVLVAISLSDLVTLPAPERAAHAKAVRTRLAELLERFAVRFPVYVLFTKADLIAGFTETYEALSREEREQVWGMTLPLDPGNDADPAVLQFDEEFRLLLGRLDERMIERVQQEPDPRRRGLIFGLPNQIASLTEVMREFLEEVFLASRYETRPLLRGVYFTSGTQEGTPIDRLIGAIARRFGLERQRLAAFSGTGRSYFLTRLLRDVVFAEASIVSADPRVERRQALLRWSVYGGSLLIFLAACTAWTVSYLQNKRLEEQVQAAVAASMNETSALNAPVLRDDDLTKVLPALVRLRKFPGGYDSKDAPVPLSMTFGLYQGGKYHSEEVAAYRRALNLLLLPRLLSRLQKQLADNLKKPEFLYDGLRIYLMLGGRHPIDRAVTTEWLTLDWQARFPGAQHVETRTALLGHLAALLDAPLQEYPLDSAVVEEARRTLRQFPLAGRAYLMLKERLAAAPSGEWRIVDYAGPAADRVLTRLSGKLLSEGIPGLYTRRTFYTEVLPRLPDLVKSVSDDSWILDDAADPKVSDRSDMLTAEVLALYYEDYVQRWEGLIADISLQPVRTTGQAADMLRLASGPNSPLKLVWQAIDRETQLAHPPETAPGTGAPAPAPAGSTRRIASVLGGGAAQPAYGQQVEDRFRQFHDMVASVGGGTALVEMFLLDVAELAKELGKLASAISNPSGASSSVADVVEVARKIESWSARFPRAMADVPKAVARNTTALVKGEARGDIGREWESKVLRFCTQALDGRYPVRRDSGVDVTPDDFARLFAPNGLIDGFVNTSLRPFVDTTQNPWKLRSTDLGGVNFSADALTQFQRAARIRDTFFGSGTTPTVRFEIRPVSVDAGSRAVLSVDGQELAYDGISSRPVVVQWPGPGGVRQSSVTFETKAPDAKEAAPAQAAQQPPAAPQSPPPPTAPPVSITKSGAWSFFRLLDSGRLERIGGPDRWRVTFAAGGHHAVYEIHTGSIVNPLASRDLAEFKCPSTL